MGKIRNVTLWLMAVVTLMGCAASRKTATGSHEERGDSTVAAVTDSVRKSDVKTDSTVHLTTDESHASGTMSEKGRGEETIIERVTESTDASGNKTTSTDRTIHRKGDYERNATYEARLKHQEEIMTRMQHTIDSLVLSNKLNVGTHWAKKDSTNVVKEKNTVDIQSMPGWKRFTIVALIFAIIFCTWLYNKNKTL
jgi:uncharacterized protein YceK